MQKISRKKKIVATVATFALVGIGSGVAYAYWTSGGTGAATATTGTSASFTVTSDPATGGALTPGGVTDSIPFHVNNGTGNATAKLTAVAVTVANSDGTTWTSVSGCSAADYTVDTPAFTPGEIAGGAKIDGTVTLTMNDSTSTQDGCKLATVPLYFVAS